MLSRGEPILRVLQSFLGACSRGRAASASWLQFLMTVPTLEQRRRVLGHFLRTFNFAARHGSMWRVVDPEAFVGRQHLWEQVIDHREEFDSLTGEVTVHGSGELVWKRRHFPGASAGGLSAHEQRSPRTLNRWRQHLRSGGIIDSQQPPEKARDATLPRHQPNGRWAYAQLWLRLAPTPEMLIRWRGRVAPPSARASSRTYSAAQPPRLDDLTALARLVEGEA